MWYLIVSIPDLCTLTYLEYPYYRYLLDSVKCGGGGQVIFLVVSRGYGSLYLHFVRMGGIQNLGDGSKSQPAPSDT